MNLGTSAAFKNVGTYNIWKQGDGKKSETGLIRNYLEEFKEISA